LVAVGEIVTRRSLTSAGRYQRMVAVLVDGLRYGTDTQIRLG
jgi:hypothetical protein